MIGPDRDRSHVVLNPRLGREPSGERLGLGSVEVLRGDDEEPGERTQNDRSTHRVSIHDHHDRTGGTTRGEILQSSRTRVVESHQDAGSSVRRQRRLRIFDHGLVDGDLRAHPDGVPADHEARLRPALDLDDVAGSDLEYPMVGFAVRRLGLGSAPGHPRRQAEERGEDDESRGSRHGVPFRPDKSIEPGDVHPLGRTPTMVAMIESTEQNDRAASATTDSMTPAQVVAALDRHIVGQGDAKRAVAIAVRNRWRRRQLPAEVAKEVAPRNIVMLGPTGVGKTEIARRMADLVKAPFVKVEATKFTEVGYVGRDVESMIRDLLEIAIRLTRGEQADAVRARAEQAAKDRLVGLLLGETEKAAQERTTDDGGDTPHERVKARLRERLDGGAFDDQEVEIAVREKPTVPNLGPGVESNDPTLGGLGSMLESMMPTKTTRRKVRVPRALEILIEEEIEPLLDQDRILEAAIERTEQDGIVFVDEIDKIAVSDSRSGADVSRQGVQRDLLPIVEGSSVSTKHGVVRTDGVLFIAAGAFHQASVSDLMPELQGRFPIRVELDALTAEDFRRILVEPESNLVEQQRALLKTEGIDLEVSDDSIVEMARLASDANERFENIGARRLTTIIEQVFEGVAYDAPERAARGDTIFKIDPEFIRGQVEPLLADEDLGRFVL